MSRKQPPRTPFLILRSPPKAGVSKDGRRESYLKYDRPAGNEEVRGSGIRRPYSDIGLSEISQSLPVKVEMNSVFIGV